METSKERCGSFKGMLTLRTATTRNKIHSRSSCIAKTMRPSHRYFLQQSHPTQDGRKSKEQGQNSVSARSLRNTTEDPACIMCDGRVAHVQSVDKLSAKNGGRRATKIRGRLECPRPPRQLDLPATPARNVTQWRPLHSYLGTPERPP